MGMAADADINNSFIVVIFLGRHSREVGNPIYPGMDARLSLSSQVVGGETLGMTDTARA